MRVVKVNQNSKVEGQTAKPCAETLKALQSSVKPTGAADSGDDSP